MKSAIAEETEQGSLRKEVSNEVMNNPGRTTSTRRDGGGKDGSNGMKNYAVGSQEVEKNTTEGHSARRTRDSDRHEGDSQKMRCNTAKKYV